MSSSVTALSGSYDYLLVTLSVVIAILAAYAALDFAVRVTAARGPVRLLRLSGGAISMGVGIWSMHYVGMLAFRLPIPVRYDWPTVLLSLLAAILASAVALFVVSRERMGLVHALLGSIMMGGGIATMHYVGMEAMRLDAMCIYSPRIVALSVVLAMVISSVALWITFHLRTDTTAWGKKKIASAFIMGAAIPVMHYTGMAAVTFIPSTPHLHDLSHAVSVSSLGTVAIIVVTLLLLGLVPLANLKLDTLSHTRQLTIRHFMFLAVLGMLAVLGIMLAEEDVSYRATSRLYVGLIVCLLAVLLLQGLLVLRPALMRIQHGIGELERTTQALHRQMSFVGLLQSVAVAANQATSTETVMQFALDRICAHTGWPVGHVYFCARGSAAELISSSLWHVEDTEKFAALCSATQRTRLQAGMGLPGRVVKSGMPAWIRDVRTDSSITKEPGMAELDVRGAFGFPVLVQGQVVAVLEFFSHRVEEPDDELLNVMANVGTQLGQVVERTRAQEQIARNAEDLARSNAELEQFAYVASHDLQEPLRMVASFTQLLQRRYQGKLDAEADEFIRYAVDGAQRMQTLILDLLSYSRLSTKGQSPRRIDASSACEAAITQLRQSIQEKNAIVTVAPLPTVVGYNTQLTQLFQNLIGNALKYCNRQQPEVHVSAAANADHWVFSVRDNGIGIEPQYFERIFQMFKRLHTREQYSGTGIGLALCQKIVARHRGRIWVDSQPGQGSNFQFTIPRTEAAAT